MLEARQLACVRDQRALFTGLDFTLSPGRLLLIEGPNGSGKTSLLRILTGLRQADEGDLLWCEQTVADWGAIYYRDVAYVGHGNGNKEDLSVQENLRFAQDLAVATLTIDEALAAVGLQGYQDTLVRYLSAGQRRRLALARLLCTDKRLWLLDEPFTSLDRASIGLFESYIERHLQQEGLVVMTSHHDLGLPDNLVCRIELSS